MKQTKHTPGPWKAGPFSSIVGCPITAQPDPKKNTIVVAGTRSAIAETPEAFREESEANARLIAAAPDLFEALEAALLMGNLPPVQEKHAQRAIAKAKGE